MVGGMNVISSEIKVMVPVPDSVLLMKIEGVGRAVILSLNRKKQVKLLTK